jgi:hypothetical protein
MTILCVLGDCSAAVRLDVMSSSSDLSAGAARAGLCRPS